MDLSVYWSRPLDICIKLPYTYAVQRYYYRTPPPSPGRSGLLLAAANGHINMVSLLLGQGAEINGYDKVSVREI